MSDLPQFDPPMERLINRLLDEAPKLGDTAGNPLPNQEPAIECQLVLLGMSSAVGGALSKTKEGTLKLMSMDKGDNGPVVVEQFFAYSSVVVIALVRKVTVNTGSRLITRS